MSFTQGFISFEAKHKAFAQLQIHLFKVIIVNMNVTESMNEVPQSNHMRVQSSFVNKA
jgi:hypothetical protein